MEKSCATLCNANVAVKGDLLRFGVMSDHCFDNGEPGTGRVWFENDVVDAHEFGHAFANAFEGKKVRLSDETYERARQFENHQRNTYPTRRKYTRIRE